jgi:hypothetical protein
MFTTMHKTGAVCVAPALALILTACDPGSLRGSIEASEDGGTYLVIADDNGGGCDAIKVDGKVWPLALERAGPISPGPHVVECSAQDAAAGTPIVIPEGMVFTFDYWGP